ncbi:MAG: ATP-binding protein [Flavobacteriales bacterium]
MNRIRKMEDGVLNKIIFLESNQESINVVTTYVDNIFENESESFQETYGNVIISITEAVNNAINHGNKNDPDKKVKVSYTKEKENFIFSIEDEGIGFDYDNVPDPTDPENLEKINGRGIFLMKNLVDDINFLDEGKRVELIFKHS